MELREWGEGEPIPLLLAPDVHSPWTFDTKFYPDFLVCMLSKWTIEMVSGSNRVPIFSAGWKNLAAGNVD